MNWTLGAAEKAPRFVWIEPVNDLSAWKELIADALEAMSIHNRCHHLAIDGERHINEIALSQR